MIDIDPSTSLAEVAARARAWIEENLPSGWPVDRARLEADWYVLLGDSGLATPTWPREHGGLGVAADAAALIADELARHDAGRPMTDFPGVALGGPTIIAWGTDEQKERFLRPLATARERWCQLFSEPGAGSDLASLSTRAVQQEDGSWRISGQKVWSSFAHISDFGLLMARTNQDVPKHRGITYFLLDMRLPGVDARPLKQLNGAAEFNEVFLDDVVVPDSARLGPVDEGWRVGITTLMAERSGLSGRPGVGPALTDALARRAREVGAWDDAAQRDRLVEAHVAEKVLQMTTIRAFVELGTREPGAEGSIRKIAHSDLEERVARLGAEIDPFGLVAGTADAAEATHEFLSAKILSIAGGTSEIQRNIIGERVLGLPRETDPHVDKPFRERPRG
ncbi:acyl-CoA dehydrogenase family protein [Aeromicrobium alkaliterrae]|uniref:Acyl-CoA dehydrogenase family protein n=1 Tax=Aeromicrobium alkaliterrae TaxID=302168 RepID=A0ABN2K1P6_9ACTN